MQITLSRTYDISSWVKEGWQRRWHLSWDPSGRQECSKRPGIWAMPKYRIKSQQVPSHKTNRLIWLLSMRRKAKRDSTGEADKGYITENLLLRELDIILKVIFTVLKQASVQRQIQGFHVRSLWGNSQGLDLDLYLMGRTLISELCPLWLMNSSFSLCC